MIFLRSLIFNILFYGLTALTSFVMLPAFILPRRTYLRVLMIYFHLMTLLEKTILGLTYRVEGLENLPKDGSYIVGMKHYSAYETMKMHILFGDPTAILKRELMWIPIWGWHAAKLRLIPINRSAKGKVIPAMIDSARDVLSQTPNRPIIIFPQGTRVALDAGTDNKPYKIGIIRLYEALDIPIVPVALNTGVFWARKAFIKHGGVVTFRILPPIEPGQDGETVLKTLADQVETHSAELVEQAQNTARVKPSVLPACLLILTLIFAAWTILWHQAANRVEGHLTHWVQAAEERGFAVHWQDKHVHGYPGPVRVAINGLTVTTLAGGIHAPEMRAQAWPLPGSDIMAALPQGFEQSAVPVTIRRASLVIKGLIPALGQDVREVSLHPLLIEADPLRLTSRGTLTLDADGYYNGGLNHEIIGGRAFLRALMDQGLISRTIGLLVEGWVNGQNQTPDQQDDRVVIETPVRGGALYIGPFKLLTIPQR